MNRSNRTRRPGDGFTILEVLISLAILTVGSTCMVALFSAALETYRRSELEFTATTLAVEILDTAEDYVAHGWPLEKLPAAIKKRVSVPPRFFYDLTKLDHDETGRVFLSVRISAEGRGKTRQWTWRRTLTPGMGGYVVPLPREAPRRYATHARGRSQR